MNILKKLGRKFFNPVLGKILMFHRVFADLVTPYEKEITALNLTEDMSLKYKKY